MTQRPIRHQQLRIWHRWMGLLAGIVLLLASVSGAILVYKKPLVRLIVTPGAALPAQYSTKDIALALDRIVALPVYHPDALIKAPNAQEPFWTLSADGVLTLLHIDSLEPYHKNAWLLEAMAFIRHLHTELLVGLTGEWLLFIGGVLGLGLCFTGPIMWWTGRRGFRWRWVLPRKIQWPMLLQYHRHSGAVSVVMLMLVLLTGSLMFWQKLVSPLLPRQAPEQLAENVPRPKTTLPSERFGLATSLVSDGWPTYIRLGSVQRPETSIRFRLPGEWHPNGRTSVKIDLDTGAVSQSRRSDQQAAAQQLINQFYPLHSAYGMGALYGALVFLSGVFMIWLGATGGIAYFRRRRLQRH